MHLWAGIYLAKPGNNAECRDLLPVLSRYAGKKQEYFITIHLDGANQVIRVKIVSIGTVNRTLVHPREVFAGAIRDSAVVIIVAHNHPSGSLEPSTDDLQVTKRLVQAGEVLGIPVLDHLIVSRKSTYYSMVTREKVIDFLRAFGLASQLNHQVTDRWNTIDEPSDPPRKFI